MTYPATDAPDDGVDLAEYLRRYYELKSAGKLEKVMEYFHEHAIYADATMGMFLRGRDVIAAAFADVMPGWVEAAAVSYPTRTVGDMTGGAAFVTGSPQMFGSEIRAIAAVDIRDGKIVRFVDYWDGVHFGRKRTAQMRMSSDRDRPEYADGVSRGPLQEIAEHLTSSKSGIENLFATDAAFEDLTLRVRVHGRASAAALLERLPYAGDLEVVHVNAGSFEWISHTGPVARGIVAVVLDSDGQIAELTSTWDGTQIHSEVLRDWTLAALDR